MWETRDPDGRRVVLTFARWRHVREAHPELANARDAILGAVASPVGRCPGRVPGEEWFYGHDIGPGLFVKVVVHFRGVTGSVTTAFPRRRFP